MQTRPEAQRNAYSTVSRIMCGDASPSKYGLQLALQWATGSGERVCHGKPKLDSPVLPLSLAFP